MSGSISRREFMGALALGTGMVARASQMPAEIRVAIIGLEGHYSEVTSAAKALPNVRITAISDTRPEALKRASQSAALGKAQAFGDYRKLLANTELEMACVCGPNHTRAEILQSCAKRGLPIVSEKPLALSLNELAGVKRAVEKMRAPLTMLLTMRGSPPYQAMREIVQRGEIGEVVSMDAQKSYKLGERPEWMKSRRTFGGTIPYIGIHMLDLMRWISGRDFVEAAAFQSAIGAPAIGDMENNCALALKLDNNGTASLRMDYLRPEAAPSHGDDRLRIVGTKGIVEYAAGQGLVLMTGDQPPRKIENFPAGKSIVVNFIESIYLKQPPLLTQEEIFRVSEIVLKVRDAADQKRIVRL